MNPDLQLDAIEREIKSSVGMIGEFIVHKQLKKLDRDRSSLSRQDFKNFITLVIKELAPLTGPKKAKELESKLLELSSLEPGLLDQNHLMPYNGGFRNS